MRTGSRWRSRRSRLDGSSRALRQEDRSLMVVFPGVVESTLTCSGVRLRFQTGGDSRADSFCRALGGPLQGLVRCRALQVRPLACFGALRLAQVRWPAQVRLRRLFLSSNPLILSCSRVFLETIFSKTTTSRPSSIDSRSAENGENGSPRKLRELYRRAKLLFDLSKRASIVSPGLR